MNSIISGRRIWDSGGLSEHLSAGIQEGFKAYFALMEEA